MPAELIAAREESARFGVVILQEEGAEETAKQLLVLRREEKVALNLQHILYVYDLSRFFVRP